MIGVIVVIVRSPANESSTLDHSGDRRFDPQRSATFHTVRPLEETPMTCKKAVFACLDTDVTFTSESIY